MSDALRSLESEPNPSRPAAARNHDVALLAGLLGLLLAEALLRPDLSWTTPALLLGAAQTFTVLGRRTRPLLMVVLAFGAGAALDAARLLGDVDRTDLKLPLVLLLLPYSLFRWGSARERWLGGLTLFVSATLGLVVDDLTVGEFLGGYAVLVSAMALGAAARNRAQAHARELDQVKLREREHLARDLHDTVAHHVSAIVIRAQAGLATSSGDPAGAVEALRVIEGEAARTLTEMRQIVRRLREGEPADFAPTPRLADLERLADSTSGGPEVSVSLPEGLDEVPPSIAAALYRLAQESVTNARRHARRATHIAIGVTADDASVRLRVTDDGDPVASRSAGGSSYGVAGMRERAKLLGGSCVAGPGEERGWTVTAVLPRDGGVA